METWEAYYEIIIWSALDCSNIYYHHWARRALHCPEQKPREGNVKDVIVHGSSFCGHCIFFVRRYIGKAAVISSGE
ncbi:hypothetical protein D3C77_576650 [compost metagenome]